MTSNPETHLDMLRIMVNEGEYDPMEQAEYSSLMHYFRGSPIVYRWLLNQEGFVIDFEQTPINIKTIAAASVRSELSITSECLELVAAHESDLSDQAGSNGHTDGLTQAHTAVCYLPYMADDVEYPKRIKVLWDAGADLHTPQLHNDLGSTLDVLFFLPTFHAYDRIRRKRYGVEQLSIPRPPLQSTKHVISYDRLENNSSFQYRSRTPRSMFYTWYPGYELSILEVAQRYLDAWMELLLEAGLDIVDYGRREDRLHPGGLFHGQWIRLGFEARVYVEYGDHVGGCRIHVTELWVLDVTEEKITSTEKSRMPGSWDFDDA